MFKTYFSPEQLLFLVPGIILIFLSIWYFHLRENKKSAVVLLVLGSLAIRIFMALLDPFLNMWDEQFHALVARNMMQHPFTPMLYADTVIPYDFKNWVGNHIWLHKQPLFLWQMALSMKLFGVNELALRLPSVLMSTLLVLMIYRTGKLAVSQAAGYYGALLFALAAFPLELVSGYWQVDHNDVAFVFYVTASIWAWAEYSTNGKKRWLILIGLFSGCAILVKWLVGLLVYSGWGLSVLADPQKRKSLTEYGNIGISFLVTCVIAIPWQIYCLIRFPQEFGYEMSLNTRHFYEVIEKHVGGYLFHFAKAEWLYGSFLCWLILPALVVLWFSIKRKDHRVAFFTFILSVYIFYTLAATKMPTFSLVVCALVFVALGAFFEKFFQVITVNREIVRNRTLQLLFPVLILAGISFANLGLDGIQAKHTRWKKGDWDHPVLPRRDAKVYKTLAELLPKDKYIITNTREWEFAMCTFYTGYPSYNWIMNEQDVKSVRQKGYKLVVLDNDNLPAYLLEDHEVIKVKSGVWQFPKFDAPVIYY